MNLTRVLIRIAPAIILVALAALPPSRSPAQESRVTSGNPHGSIQTGWLNAPFLATSHTSTRAHVLLLRSTCTSSTATSASAHSQKSMRSPKAR